MATWIDGHIHFWNRALMSYPWLENEPPLDRDFTPLGLGADRHLLSGVVMVEAGRRDDQWAAELDWVESLAEGDTPAILGMVAHAQVEDPLLRAEQLDRLSAHPLVVGVRRNIQDEPAGFVLERDFVAGVAALANYGLPFDLCVRHWQLAEVTELVRRLPEVSFVLDHCGKPAIADGALEPWRRDVARLAELPNVACKLSGLSTEADRRGWHARSVLPYLRHALAVFGADRCLFGSDWPVATLATTYGRWMEVVASAISELSDVDKDAVAGGTATRVYGLADRRLRTPEA